MACGFCLWWPFSIFLTPHDAHTHTHQSKPQIRSSLLARRHMWLSGLGASLAFPHSYNALLPANVSLLPSTRTWAWRPEQMSAHSPVSHPFCCVQVVRAVGSGLTPSVLFLAPTMSSDLRLGTACLPTVLSPSGGWSRWPCLTLSPLTSEVSLLLGLTNLVQDAGLGGGGREARSGGVNLQVKRQ